MILSRHHARIKVVKKICKSRGVTFLGTRRARKVFPRFQGNRRCTLFNLGMMFISKNHDTPPLIYTFSVFQKKCLNLLIDLCLLIIPLTIFVSVRSTFSILNHNQLTPVHRQF